MNKEKLNELKENMETLETRQNKLTELKTKFEEENIDLIGNIDTLKNKITRCKEILTENAEAGYLKDGEKKRLGGVGIRVMTDLNYEMTTALDWAKEHKLCLIPEQLDNAAFRKIAKTQELDFVTKSEKITVTFPKEIILED